MEETERRDPERNLSQYLNHLKGRGGNPDEAIRKTFGKICLTLLAARESLEL